jgi:superfamily I DNA/RNA helicase
MAQELDIANTKAGAGGLRATSPAFLLRIPPPPRPDRRPLQLMRPGLPPRAPVEQPQSKPSSPPSAEPTAPALINRRLEKELAELEAEVEALQQMLQELPTILEGKFQARLRQLRDQQQSLASTCVTARTNKAVEKLEGWLKAEGFATRVINADESDDPSDPALRLATMHRVKGLEFDQIFLPGLDASQMPLQFELNTRPDPLSKDLFEQQERSLLHVAATRAKKRVVVSFSGKASPFLRPA